jgi:hypothetical protein
MRKLFTIIILLTIAILSNVNIYGAENDKSPENVLLVKAGKPLFRIIVADKPGKKYEPWKWHSSFPSCWLYFAAAELSSYIEKSTGAKAEVLINKTKNDSLVNIHLGMTDFVKKLKPDLPKNSGFVIQFPDKKNIIIAGMSVDSQNYNTFYGVSYFLKTYLGIKWLFPGELGEYIPKRDTLAIPATDIRTVPDFTFRGFSGYLKVYSDKKKIWGSLYYAMRMGLTTSLMLEFNHNVGNIIDPDKYMKTHPEFFPLINGKRHFPKPNPQNKKWRLGGWEPCYSADGIVEEAAKNIVQYFDKYPGRCTFSLSVNDTGNICRCKKCAEKNKHLPVGSESQTYYEWVNKVVEKVRVKYPDRYFGLLVYWIVNDPPANIKLNDHIVPVICRDLKYFNSTGLNKKVNYKQIAVWDKAAPTLGWWDYTFEGSYLVPAFYAHHLADTLKYLYKHNLRFYFDELHPGKYWKNAPQIYMVNRLLWNIDLDADSLLNEWYEAAVGRKAAPYLAKYFAVWEKFWTERIPKTDWFKRRAAANAPFLQRRYAGYLEALTLDDVLKCDELLKKTVDLAETEKQKKRAEFIYKYFAMAKNRYFLPYLNGRAAKNNSGKERIKILHQYNFASGLEGWVAWQRRHHTANLSHDKKEGKSGRGCLLLSMKNSLPTPMINFHFDCRNS